MSNHANFRQNAQQTQELQSLSGSIDTANTLQIDTNTKLDSLIANAGVLPVALTGSGNLKVCIQELGNEGSERLNVEIGDVDQFPTALTGAGNLKVSIQEEFNSGLATSTNQTAQTSHLNTLATASATQATSTNQTAQTSHLNTLALASATQATASNQTAQTAHLNTLATASSAQATASNQTTANGHLSTIASNTELKGFTDITDASSSVRLSAENGGKLQVQVVGSNDISGGTPHRHLTIDANGRTLVNPLMTTTNTKLDSVVSNTTKSRVVVRLTSVPAISANSGGTSYDLGADFATYATMKITGDVNMSQPQDLYIQISADNVNWNWKTGLGFISANGGGFMGFFCSTTIDQPLRYWRIFNNSGGMASPVLDTLMSVVSVE